MPELRNFPKGYDYAFNDFTAFVLLENEAAGYRRFIDYDRNIQASRLIKPFTPVFFITVEEGDALVEVNRPQASGWKPSEHQIDLVRAVVGRVPSGDLNRWQLVRNNSLATLFTV
jgi:hypothetical protein